MQHGITGLGSSAIRLTVPAGPESRGAGAGNLGQWKWDTSRMYQSIGNFNWFQSIWCREIESLPINWELKFYQSIGKLENQLNRFVKVMSQSTNSVIPSLVHIKYPMGSPGGCENLHMGPCQWMGMFHIRGCSLFVGTRIASSNTNHRWIQYYHEMPTVKTASDNELARILSPAWCILFDCRMSLQPRKKFSSNCWVGIRIAFLNDRLICLPIYK